MRHALHAGHYSESSPRARNILLAISLYQSDSFGPSNSPELIEENLSQQNEQYLVT